ncbi:hypothetical protein C1H76_1906 [Elsinoe australis]|uniref:Uncharacterized protein n=1 Tax=Elsinoe australis TaxID=40998 RepID=A0A4U7B8I4_9PEZI|nr:hypothetical protein C1H76_1906 [Elsinoe australis]
MPAFSNFQPRHFPALLLATTLALGGTMPLFNGERAIQEFGLPQRIAISKPAQTVMTTSSARVSAVGLSIWAMYFNGHYQAIDIVMASLGYVGIIDCWVCWKEGVTGKAIFRVLAGSFISVLGFLKTTGG